MIKALQVSRCKFRAYSPSQKGLPVTKYSSGHTLKNHIPNQMLVFNCWQSLVNSWCRQYVQHCSDCAFLFGAPPIPLSHSLFMTLPSEGVAGFLLRSRLHNKGADRVRQVMGYNAARPCTGQTWTALSVTLQPLHWSVSCDAGIHQTWMLLSALTWVQHGTIHTARASREKKGSARARTEWRSSVSDNNSLGGVYA